LTINHNLSYLKKYQLSKNINIEGSTDTNTEQECPTANYTRENRDYSTLD